MFDVACTDDLLLSLWFGVGGWRAVGMRVVSELGGREDCMVG